ncbi:MAG TPA: hypothetical protein VF736_13580 [Pyrinomonadaceae bacterium]|jgi:hypothetical protein
MPYKIENVPTDTWHLVIEDLKGSGFVETYCYGGADAGIDYSRYDLTSLDGGETIVFEWDNWSEGEIKAAPARLESLREKYGLPAPAEV